MNPQPANNSNQLKSPTLPDSSPTAVDASNGELLVKIGQGTNGGEIYVNTSGVFAGIAVPQNEKSS